MAQDFFIKEHISSILPYPSLQAETIVQELQQGNGRISLSGVQNKFSAIADQGKLRLIREGEQGRYIIKPIPQNSHIFEKESLPINEFLCMQIASNIYHIETAECGVCRWQDGSPAYVTKRFDVKADGSKRGMEDFAALAGLTKADGGSDYKYCNLSYEECAHIINLYVAAAPIAIHKFFRLVIYNFLISNDDAHLKNFSLIENADKEYMLAPAYDLVNTYLHLHQPRIFALDKGLLKEGIKISDTHPVNKALFCEFGRRIGLTEKVINNEIKNFSAENTLVQTMVYESMLSENMKKQFYHSFKYRQYLLSS